MVYVPAKAEIPDRICVLKGYNWDYSKEASVGFSSKVNDPPSKTIDIIPNIINGTLYISPIDITSANFYSTCDITHCLHFTDIGKKVVAQINYWALNDLIFSGCVDKGGRLRYGTELVAVVYGGHS